MLYAEPRRPSSGIPKLDRLVMSLLENEPDSRRYKDFGELMDALNEIYYNVAEVIHQLKAKKM